MDLMPISVGSLVAAAGPLVPGPTKDEWTGMLLAFVALAARELVAFIRRRRT